MKNNLQFLNKKNTLVFQKKSQNFLIIFNLKVFSFELSLHSAVGEQSQKEHLFSYLGAASQLHQCWKID